MDWDDLPIWGKILVGIFASFAFLFFIGYLVDGFNAIIALQFAEGVVIIIIAGLVFVGLVYSKEDLPTWSKFTLPILSIFALTFSFSLFFSGYDHLISIEFAGAVFALNAGVLTSLGMIYFKEDLPKWGTIALPISGILVAIILMGFLPSILVYTTALQIFGGVIIIIAGGIIFIGVYYYRDDIHGWEKIVLSMLGIFAVLFSIGFLYFGLDYNFGLLLAGIAEGSFIIGIFVWKLIKMGPFERIIWFKTINARKMKIPIVGPRGSGKTWFICALDLYLYSFSKAHIVTEGRSYLVEMQANILKRTDGPSPVGQTEKKTLVKMFIDPEKLNLDFTPEQPRKMGGFILTSGDISGESFKQRDDSFKEFIKNTEMLILLIDKNDVYGIEVGDILDQISRAVQVALDFKKVKFILFILTKNDSEFIPSEQLKVQFKEKFKPVLGHLTSLNVKYEILSCSSLGKSPLNKPEPLKPEGFDIILKQIVEMCQS